MKLLHCWENRAKRLEFDALKSDEAFPESDQLTAGMGRGVECVPTWACSFF